MFNQDPNPIAAEAAPTKTGDENRGQENRGQENRGQFTYMGRKFRRQVTGSYK
jgi:hypothetical protein